MHEGLMNLNFSMGSYIETLGELGNCFNEVL
jgi:hypothetical protein